MWPVPCFSISLATLRVMLKKPLRSDDGLMEREVATTRKLRSRYALASASPIPCEAPVMIATFCSAPMMGLHDLCRDGDHHRLRERNVRSAECAGGVTPRFQRSQNWLRPDRRLAVELANGIDISRKVLVRE